MACSVGINRDADENTAVNLSLLNHLYQAFLEAMEDYTVDNRGDVGAWYESFDNNFFYFKNWDVNL